MRRLFQELAKNEYRKPSAGYLELKLELASGNAERLDNAILREFARMEAAGKKPYVDHKSYGAAVGWLLNAFPLGKYNPEKGEFERELEVYHPVIKTLAKHEIIAACAKDAGERTALKKLFNRVYSARGKKTSKWNKALQEFVEEIGVERSRKIFSTPVEKTFKTELIEKLGDEGLLSKKALKLGKKYGLKPEKSFTRHLYAQGMMVWYCFFGLLADSFESLYEKKQ